MDNKDSYSIPAFCEKNDFSRAHYYNLPENKRPRTIRLGRRVLITREAADRWRREREAENTD